MKYMFMFLLIALTSFGFAHGYLASSTPTDGALLSEAPTEIVLEFKEAIEINFSIFKVYPLPEQTEISNQHTETVEGIDHNHEETASGEDADGEHSEEGQAHSAMDAVAETFVPTVLELEGDQAARVDTGLLSKGTAKKIIIALKDDLAPGAYVVMWRVLSTDTHTVDGFMTFEITP
jgi:copper resistance protein C